MSETETSIEVVPWTGEVVDVTIPQEASRRLLEATTFWYELKAFQNRCRDTLRAESDRLGQRTFSTGEHTVEVASVEASTDTVYDVDRLWHELEQAGLPLERLGELITYTPKVDGVIIRQLKRSPQYAEIIADAVMSTSPKTRAVKIK